MYVSANEIETVDNFVQCLYCSDKNGVHMHVQAMMYQLCNFSDSAYALKPLIFAF